MQSQTLRNYLAAEYVLGTLSGAARKRFEYYISQDPSLQALVQKWGQVLNPMGSLVEAIEPPKRVWKEIERRLNLKNSNKSLWSSLALWRTISLIGATLTIVVGLYLGPFKSIQPSLPTDYLAVIENSQSQGAWVISTDLKQKRLIVRNLKTQQIASNKDFELWLLPDASKKKTFKSPISVGLIRASAMTELSLSDKVFNAIQQAGGVAVSLEPQGGSPTGLPTGPVLYQGKLQLL